MPPTPPPSPNRSQKIVTVAADVERMTAESVVANRMKVRGLRAYNAEIEQVTEVDIKEVEEEYVFQQGFRAEGPVIIGTHEPGDDVFKEIVTLQGNQVRVDGNEFEVVAPTTLKIREGDGDHTLRVEGNQDVTGNMSIQENLTVDGDINANAEGKTAKFRDVQVDNELGVTEHATFNGGATFTNADGNSSSITGDQYTGTAAKASGFVDPPKVTIGGNYFEAEFDVQGGSNVNSALVPVVNAEEDPEDMGDLMFTNRNQLITSEKTWNQDIKFSSAEYGVDGWSNRWKDNLRLRLGGDLDGEVSFRGDETTAVLDARIRQAFGSVPNVRLYVSSAEGRDSNPGNNPNFPVRSIKRAAELAQEYVERRNGRFPNFSKINFPAKAYQNPGKSQAYTVAADIIWNNRDIEEEGLIDKMSAFLDSEYNDLADQETNVPGFETVGEICRRDAGFLIEAVCSDLTYGGTLNMARAAARYFEQFKRPLAEGTGGASRRGEDRLVLPSNQRDATFDVWDNLRKDIKELLGESYDLDVLDTIDALFEGLKNTLTDPLPFQTNFSFETRSDDAFGNNEFSEFVGGETTFSGEDGAAIPYQNAWIAKIEEYLETLDLEEETEPNVTFTKEKVREIYNAVAEDMKNGGIEHSARKAGEFFSENVRRVREGNVRPIVLALQYAEQLVVDDAIVLQAEVDSVVLGKYVERFRGLMEGVYTTIQFPTTFAPTPVTIFVTSGVYVEEPPIYLAPNVSVVGDSLRSVLIYANKGTGSDRTDFFHCNSGVYLFNLRFRDIREPGFCAAFPSALVDINTTTDDIGSDGIRQYYQVVGPDTPDEAKVLFSYPGYTKFNRPKVYVDEPRDSNTIVEEIIVTDHGENYQQEDLDALITANKIRIRNIGEQKNVIRDENGQPIPLHFTEGGLDWHTMMDEYYDEDNRESSDVPTGGPDVRAQFEIIVEDGAISSIVLKTDSQTGRPLHGKGYRSQAAFLDLPAPRNGGRRARAIVVMKSDYAEMSIPDDGIDENGRITKVKIDHPGSGYTDVTKPWISIPPPVDLQPYVNASPYVQNCSNLSGPFDNRGNLVPKTLPLPFDVNDIYGDNTDVSINPNGAGGGIRIDGACVAPRSPVPSFVTDAFTQLNQGGIGFLLINRGYAQLVSTFGLFCSTHVKALGGSFANISNTVTDFGIESMHARGYWPVPYAKTTIIAPRVMNESEEENQLVTDHPLKLDAGMFNPTIDQETSGVYIPNEGYRSEVRLDEAVSFWGTEYDTIAVTEEDFPAETNAYYLVTEIDPPPSQSSGNLTARFESPSNEYAAYLNQEWVPFEVNENRWIRKENGVEIIDRTVRVRTFVKVTRENLVSGSGEFLSLSVAKDWAKGDNRDESDRQLFKGAGYKEIPNVTVKLVHKNNLDDGVELADITRPVGIRMSLSRVTPIVVKLDNDLVRRLVRPKFMSVCRINGVWHTVRGVTRVGSEDQTIADPFEPGEYALTLFPAVNWVNDQTELDFYDASYISTNSHAMEYVGSGVTYNALPEYGGVPNSAGEVVEFSPGRVFFTTQDQLGNTRIGKDFSVDQLSGRVSINTDQFNLAGLSSIGPFRNDDGETVGVQLRSVSNNPNLTSDMPGNTVPTQQAVLGYFQRFVIPQPEGPRMAFQAQNINNVLRTVWERPRAGDLQGTLPNDPNNSEENVFPSTVNVDDLVANNTITANEITSLKTITGKNMTLSDNLSAGSVGDQNTKIRGIWEGRGSGQSFGNLSGIPLVFTCQVNEGNVKRMSFGGPADANNDGVRMPRPGKIVSLTVQGSQSIRLVRNGVPNTNTTYGGNSSHSNPEISFDETDRINFETVLNPTGTVVVTFFVVFE